MKKYFKDKSDYSEAEYVLDMYPDFSKKYTFSNFNDFIKACKYDLSDANLSNIPNNIKISKNERKLIKYNDLTILPDYIWQQLGVAIPKIIYNFSQPTELFAEAKKDNYKISTKTIPFEPTELGKIDYISDLHLDNKIPKNASLFQAALLIEKLLRKMYNSRKSNLQIFAGDISHNKILFCLFINILTRFDGKKILILGNHEFWDFKSIKEAKEYYNKIIQSEKDIILLHNDLLCVSLVSKKFTKISEKQLLNWSNKDNKIFNKNFDSYQYFILGGCGFSGLNSLFNATNGLYFNCLNYKIDKVESNKFDTIFNLVSLLTKNKSLIVISHTPYTNWHQGSLPNIKTNIFYINGHTHTNRYERIDNNFIYADNQMGYKYDIRKARFKSLLFKEDFDYFYSFVDGIKKITYQEYLNFLRGKRLGTELKSNESYNLYLIRKNGYSMFIRENKKGDLCLLYKGQAKTLPQKPLQYFYDNIEYSIDKVRVPLIEFNNLLNKISKEVKSFGGDGYIHGQIIDIDFDNHLYVNPIDKQVTPYFAKSTIIKTIYPTIDSLLKHKNKSLYNKYVKLINSNSLSVIKYCKLPNIKKPEEYLETDIYKTNRVFHKLDLSIYKKIIGLWVEPNQTFYKITNIKLLYIKQ